MTVEARLGDAVLDLEGRIIEGMDIELAIRETADEHYFKDEVLRVRATKLLGALDLVKSKSDRRVAMAQRQRDFMAVIDAYTDDDVDCSMREWLVGHFKREPSHEELKIAFQRSTERWLANHIEELRD